MTQTFGSRRGGSWKVRLGIMAVIGLISVVGYLGKCNKNPQTGEWQAVDLTPKQEMALGLNTTPEMVNQMGGEYDPERNEDAARVSAMGHKLVDTGKAKDSPYYGNFHFHLLADPKTINAFALPGGQVFITRALYDQLENEAQLAGVLGHEIGHVIHRHSAEQMAKSKLSQGLVGAVVAGTGDYSSGNAAQMVAQMIQLKYGRGDELEADNWGLYNMAKAGYDPTEMVKVMEILKKAGGGGGQAQIFSTHPNPDLRIKEIKQYIEKAYPSGVPGDLSSGKALH